jgi:D-sedoheptulose 7-phosphate isomerase
LPNPPRSCAVWTRAQSKSWRNCWPRTRARGGRLFILGVGGSAANASHAVNDFRKICGMEAYCPTDNVSELTARTNDEGWASVFEAWLRVSRLRAEDCVLVFSVGGGNLEKQVSPNLVSALQYAKSVGASIGGVIGRATATPRKWRMPA